MTTGDVRTLPPPRWKTQTGSAPAQYLLAAAVVLGVTLASFLLRPWVGYRSVALIYLLAVVFMALSVGRGAMLFAAAMSALFWDFFFLAPITHLHIAGVEDAIMFGMYFAVALVLGQLTSRISAQERAKRQGEERATALFLLTRGLAGATTLDQLMQLTVEQVERALRAQIVLLLPDSAQRLSYHAHPGSTYEMPGPEQPVAGWVFEHRKPAGKFSDNGMGADALYVPLLTGDGVMGVMGLSFHEPFPPTIQQQNLLEDFSQQIALALNRHHLREEFEAAKRQAESERLGKTLLDSMSHEIRTPIAAIKSAAGNLVEFKETNLSEFQQQMIGEIQEATERLIRMVGNSLDVSRLESGHLKPKFNLCDVGDLIHLAAEETKAGLARHKLEIELAPGLPLVRMDFVLMQQVLINLLSNAAIYTPPGSAVQLAARVRNGDLVLTVADRGPGIPSEAIPRLFEKFYRLPGSPTGGTGLGLSLVKGFVESQGGRVKVENRFGGGAVFAIHLPVTTALPAVSP